MQRLLKLAVGFLLGAVALRSLVGWFDRDDAGHQVTFDDVVGHVAVQKELEDYVHEAFPDKIEFIKVTDRVLAVVGASILNSNVYVVDAPDGLIIVDTTESQNVAAKIFRELRRTTDRPVKAVIYSHFHADHTQGTEVFVEDPKNPPDVWAHHTLIDNILASLIPGPKSGHGNVHQFGSALGSAQVWPRIKDGLTITVPIKPNKLVMSDVETHVIAGMNVTFMHVPGESDDHLAVWLPDDRVIFPGDTVYRSFPNLYPVRGIPQRDPLLWAASVRKLRDLNADVLLPSHTKPITGRQAVYDLMTVYESALRYVHDQTVRRMNELYHPDEIAEMVRLPPALATHRFMGEFYGKVNWAVKGVYGRYVGWFSGDPVELEPLTPSERSKRLVKMIGEDRLLEEAEQALQDDDVQWALELSSHVFRVRPDNLKARRTRLQALRSMAAAQVNPTARNFFLTTALKSQGLLNAQTDVSSIIMKIDIDVLLNLMAVKLKAELTHGVNTTIFLRFKDSGKTFRLQILYSVLTVDLLPSDAKVAETETVLTTREPVWRGILTKQLTAAAAFSSGDLKVSGAVDTVRQFLSYF